MTATPRSTDARVQSLRDAIGEGDVEVAKELMAQVAGLPGLQAEEMIFQARLCSMQGEALRALKWVETARAQYPDDARVAATSIELSATEQRYDSAYEELKVSQQRFGETPELLRAEAIWTIFRPGLRQGSRGVDLLERAVAADPGLPYAKWPLSEAHRLRAQSLAATRLAEAVQHAEKSVEYSPENRISRELLGDLYMSSQRWGEGIELLEGLLVEGEPIEAKVGLYCKNAGVVALTQGDKQLALDYFVRARELGLDAQALGTGYQLLRRSALEQASKASGALKANDLPSAMVHLGRAQQYWPDATEVRALLCDLKVRDGLLAYSKGDFVGAQENFSSALVEDPESLLARHLLGRTFMQRGMRPQAIEAWSNVLQAAYANKIALPDPVHLGLATAYELEEQRPDAKAALLAYLDHYPEGEFAPETRERLKSFE